MASEEIQGATEAAAQSASTIASKAGSTSQSLWDRLSNWASENKGVVYTIAGVTLVVTGAGAIYYVTSSSKTQAPVEERRSKKERRKAKKAAEEASKSPAVGVTEGEHLPGNQKTSKTAHTT